MEKTTAGTTAKHLAYIDCLRALACMAVIGQHTVLFTKCDAQHGEGFRIGADLANRGWLGVSLFLVLSGFCLFLPMARKNDIPDMKLDIRGFFSRRCWRILPPFYLCLVIYAGLKIGANIHRHSGVMAGFGGAKDIPLHLLMLHNLFSSTVVTINPPFWSLALEFQLYLVFPLLIFMMKRASLPVTLGLALFASAAYQAFVIHKLGHNPSLEHFASRYNALPGRVFEFAAGMAAAYLVARPKQGQARYAVAIIAALFIPVLLMTGDQMNPPLLRDQLCGLFFASIVVACAAIPAKYFNSQGLQLLTTVGACSYSVYLYHQPILQAIGKVAEPIYVHSVPAYAAFSLVRAIVLIAIGKLMYELWEKRWIAKPKPA